MKMRGYCIIGLVCYVLTGSTQVNYDSLRTAVDTITGARKKIDVVFEMVKKKELTVGDFDKLTHLITRLAVSDSGNSAYASYKIAHLYSIKKNYHESIKRAFVGLIHAEREKDTLIMANLYHRLGHCYRESKNIPFAKKYYYRSVEFSKNGKNMAELSETYNALGTIFKNDSIIDSALYYNKKALEIRLKLGDLKTLASTYNNIGLAYKKKHDYDLARIYLEKALALREQIGDKKGKAGANINIGNVLISQGKYKKALEYVHRGTDLAFEIGDGDFFKNGIDALANCYYELKDYKKSADYRLRYKIIFDSITTDYIDRQIAEFSAQYESGKKDSEIALKEEQLRSREAENSKQRILTTASVVALILALVAVFFIYRSFRLNKESARELALKNKIIAEKNKDITDSINYAKHIQQSLLAPAGLLKQHLKDFFIIYKPKDIVSGDFYWASVNEDAFTIACVDCTGHGVPGAFMSLIGKENLDKAYAITQRPGLLLEELNRRVKSSLNQTENTGSRDGMDAAIVGIKKLEAGAELSYSGANRPLWIIREDSEQIEEIKATKNAVGGFSADDQVFTEHQVYLNTQDRFFIFTDGYPDQFGGNHQKKITTKLFKELLLKYRHHSMDQTCRALEDFFETWRGAQEQIDDILVIGVLI
jgi:serine phosphatase RsbU (regulator of sigma subunit)